MGWRKKKPDPISDRARALNEEIAALEDQIRRLDARIQSTPAAPRLRSTALPHTASTIVHHHDAPAAPPAVEAAHANGEPIFEEVNQSRLKNGVDHEIEDDEPDLGTRKRGLFSFIDRLRNNFRGPPAMNPKLVNYLAAGSIQGLRPMRYEKRVARNRFLFTAFFILALLAGVLAYIHIRR